MDNLLLLKAVIAVVFLVRVLRPIHTDYNTFSVIRTKTRIFVW